MRIWKIGSVIFRKLFAIRKWLYITGVIVFLACLALILEPAQDDNPFKVLFNSAESIAIISAVALYFIEIPERKKQRHYEAWQVIDNAKDIQTSYARRKAIEDLYEDGESFYEIDLPGADLQGINLSKADLRNADLKKVNLSSANLWKADLSGANLSGADLSDANLRDANFCGATLSLVSLVYADLRDTNLSLANLTSASLWKADLRGAYLWDAAFYNAYLEDTNLQDIKWNNETQWPAPEEVAKARNIPSALKQQLGIE